MARSSSFLVILSSTFLISGLAQATLFNCQSSSQHSGQVYSPNIPDFYFNDMNAADYRTGSDRNLTDAQDEYTYIFNLPSPQPNCTGTLLAVEYCYRVDSRSTNQMTVFSLLSLSRNGDAYTVLSRFDVRSTPTNSKCTDPQGPIKNICCDRTNFPIAASVPTTSYSYGVIIVNSNARPLVFRNSVTDYNFMHLQLSLGNPGPPVDNTFTVSSSGSSSVNRPLLIMRFFIDPGSPITTTDPEVATTTAETTTTEALMTTTEAALNITEAVTATMEATTEAAMATTEAVTATTEAVTVTTEAATATTEAATATTEAATATTEATTEAATATTEAATATTEAVTATTEAATATTEALTPTTGAVMATTEDITVATGATGAATMTDAPPTAPTTETATTIEVLPSTEETTMLPSTDTATTEAATAAEVATSTDDEPATTEANLTSTTTRTATESESNASISENSDNATTSHETTTLLGNSITASGAFVGGVAGGISAFCILILMCVVLVLIVASRRRSKKYEVNADNGMQITNALYEEFEREENYAGTGPHVYSKVMRTTAGKNTYAESGASYDKRTPHPCEHAVEEDIYMVPGVDENTLYSQLKQIKIQTLSRDSIKLEGELGSGQFGVVFKGLWQSAEGNIEVAVKTLKEGSLREERVKFLQEAAIMGQFRHPNVVSMYGVVITGEPILIVLELLCNGDLQEHLRDCRQADGSISGIDDHTLLSYCRQVASGMAYLSNKAFVHRDLAARNILVSNDNICKIADFGMSRDLMDENYYVSSGGKIPVKWTAPEALHYKKYSTASDVWSYGVLMYEIWSLGHKPFEEITNIQAIARIDKGDRLAPPPGCPRELYSIMMSCWHPKTSERPSFSEISRQLSLPDPKLLKWSEEDKAVHPEAAKLGADLLSAQELYKDLQLKYKEQDSDNNNHSH